MVVEEEVGQDQVVEAIRGVLEAGKNPLKS